jgi:hypothetical protein
MATDITQIEKGELPSTESSEIDFAIVLSRVIESAQKNPAELRSTIYEIARIKLEQEGLSRNSPIEMGEMRQLAIALETAIERVEAVSLRQQEQRAVQWLDGLIRTLSIEAPHEPPQEAVLVIDSVSSAMQDASLVQKISVAAGRIAQTLWQFWKKPASIPLLRVFAVVLVSITVLYAMFGDRFGALKSSAGLIQIVETPETRDALNRKLVPERRASTSGRVTIGADVPDETPIAVLRPNSSSVTTRTREFPLPTAYGIYAISNGELVELDTLPGQAPDQRIFMSAVINKPSHTMLSSGRISFLAFRRDLATSAPDRVSVRVVASVMRAMKVDARGKAAVTKIEGSWAIRNVAYNYRVAPLAEQPEMLLMQSELPDFVLPAGRYGMILKDIVYDFSVAGPVTEPAQCLERTVASNGTFYSECRNR